MSENASILIVEDDVGHFALIRKNLWRTCVGREIIHYQNGEELLHFLSSRENDTGISSEYDYLLLLDIRLPGIDGIEVLRRIRNNTELHKMPVIMLTTSFEKNDIDRSYSLGCNAYIHKPLDYNDFMETVEYLGRILSAPEFKWPSIHKEKIGFIGPS